LSAGTSTEIRQASATGAKGLWTIAGASHSMAAHNMQTDSAWFYPLFVVERLLSDPNVIVSYVGTQSGTLHILAAEGSQEQSTMPGQHLSQVDLYLDAVSFLPVGLGFNLHPDNNALVDIPVYVQFLNYQQVAGVDVPMRVRKFLNNTLTMDIQVQSVAMNTGLSLTDFTAQ
jgi:hypothetical protein